MIYIIISLIICVYIFIFSMCYIARKSDDRAEQLFNDMMKGNNNGNKSNI